MKAYSLFFLLFYTVHVYSQVVETPQEIDTTKTFSSGELLNQGSIGIPTPYTAPRVTLKTYRLTAMIGKSPWDLYFFNTVPTFTINRADSVKVFANDLLNQIGGLLNVSLSKVGYFAYGGDQNDKDVRGAQLDFRAGAKLLDSQTRETNSGFIIPIIQSTLDLRYLIPLVRKADSNAKSGIKSRMVGNLSFRLYGTFMQVLNKDSYYDIMKTHRGNAPAYTVWTGSYEINFFITNQIYLSYVQSFTNDFAIPNRTNFYISYSAPIGSENK